MKRARVGMIATAVLAVATMAFAQKPDFSGTWTPDAAAAPAGTAGAAPAGAPAGGGGQMGGGRGMAGPMTVKQTADTLTIEREGRNGTMTTSYKLDGSETEVAMGQSDGQGHREVRREQTRDHSEDRAGRSTQTWSLTGGTLTIERTGGRGPSTTTYKKTT